MAGPRARWMSGIGRWPAWGLIAAYLAMTGQFMARQAVGDLDDGIPGYFFTWDMFPWHYVESSRRVAIGQTLSGRYVQIVPSGLQQFRGGVNGDLTRADLDRQGGFFRPMVERTLTNAAASDGADAVRHVWLVEQYWPARFNLPPDLYAAWAGTPRPERRYWRVRDEFDWQAAAASDLESAP